jgi:hypothetical protein
VEEEEVYTEEVVDEVPPKALTALDELVAIKPAKALFASLTDAAQLAEERQDDLRETSFSCVFSGNPGTGKSTVMKLYGSLLEELKVAPQGKTVETTGGELARGGTDGFEALVKKSFADPQTSILKVGDKVEARRGATSGRSCSWTRIRTMSDMGIVWRSKLLATESGTSARKEVFY